MAGINPYYRRKVRVQKLGFKELEGVLKNEGTVRVSYKDGSAFLWDTAQDFSSVAIPSGATGKGARRFKVYIYEGTDVISAYLDVLNGGATSIKLFNAQAGGSQNVEGGNASIPAGFDTGGTLTYKIIPLF